MLKQLFKEAFVIAAGIFLGFLLVAGVGGLVVLAAKAMLSELAR